MHSLRNFCMLLIALLGSIGCEKHEPARVIATAPDRMPDNPDASSNTDDNTKKLEANSTGGAAMTAPMDASFSSASLRESAKPANAVRALEVLSWHVTSDIELPGKRPREGETAFVVVNTRIPASAFWERAGDDFYSGSARSAKLLSPKGKTYNADAWALDADAQFTENTTSAYIPNGPVGAEAVRFAFFVSVDSVGMPGASIQYGDSPIVELTLSKRTNQK
jgi:hypothetical protein